MLAWINNVREILSTPPAWTRLRFVSNSTAAKVTILVPVIGYLIIFNQNVVEYLNIVRELGGHQVSAVSHRLIFIYLGLCFVSLGVLIYGWLCPNEVKHYGGAAAFIQGDGPSLRGFVMNDIQLLVAKDPRHKEKLEELSRGMERKKDISGLEDGDFERYRIENLHMYFDLLNLSHPTARRIVLWSYATGFGLLAIPSAEVFVRVVGLLGALLGRTLAMT